MLYGKNICWLGRLKWPGQDIVAKGYKKHFIVELIVITILPWYSSFSSSSYYYYFITPLYYIIKKIHTAIIIIIFFFFFSSSSCLLLVLFLFFIRVITIIIHYYYIVFLSTTTIQRQQHPSTTSLSFVLVCKFFQPNNLKKRTNVILAFPTPSLVARMARSLRSRRRRWKKQSAVPVSLRAARFTS